MGLKETHYKGHFPCNYGLTRSSFHSSSTNSTWLLTDTESADESEVCCIDFLPLTNHMHLHHHMTPIEFVSRLLIYHMLLIVLTKMLLHICVAVGLFSCDPSTTEYSSRDLVQNFDCLWKMFEDLGISFVLLLYMCFTPFHWRWCLWFYGFTHGHNCKKYKKHSPTPNLFRRFFSCRDSLAVAFTWNLI